MTLVQDRFIDDLWMCGSVCDGVCRLPASRRVTRSYNTDKYTETLQTHHGVARIACTCTCQSLNSSCQSLRYIRLSQLVFAID